MNKIITIGREFGSGGRELGKRLAKELGYEYYDKEILTEIVTQTSLSEHYVKQILEKNPQRFFFSNAGSSFSFAEDYGIKQMQTVYAAQTKVIREMAHRSNCVIVGRCADFILESETDIQLFKLFVCASMEARLKRCYERAPEGEHIPEKEMRKHIQKIDKNRASYYSEFTLREWGDKQNYDFCINTTGVDLAALTPALARMVELPPKTEI